jgi:hypothetical protein
MLRNRQAGLGVPMPSIDRARLMRTALLLLLAVALYISSTHSDEGVIQTSIRSRIIYTAQSFIGAGEAEAAATQAPALPEPELQAVPEGEFVCHNRDVAVDILTGPAENAVLKRELRPACAFGLRPEDLVVGIFTSRSMEHKVEAVMETWGRKLPVELLASGEGRGCSIPFRGGGRVRRKVVFCDVMWRGSQVRQV